MENDHQIELRSEEVQEILDKVPHWMIRWGNVVILIIFLLAVFMSWIISYPDTVTGQIVITTQNPPEKIISKSSGRIEKILIHNTEKVSSGSPLAIIENAADYKDVFKLKKEMESVKSDGKTFTFPLENTRGLQLGDISGTFAAFEKEYIAYKLNTDLQPYSVEIKAQDYEMIQLTDRLDILVDQKAIATKEYSIKKNELERYKKLYDKGVIAAQEWDSKNLDFLRFEKELENINTSISQLKSSLNDLGKNFKSTKINKKKDDINLLRNTIQSYNLLKKAISDWELTYVLSAKIDGMVSFLRVWKENQTVVSGEMVFTIIPENEGLYIGKVKAIAQNSGKLKVGQDVNIRLNNYPEKEFGILSGKVCFISQIPDKEGYLLIDISLPKKLLTSYKKQIVFQQEMNGTADIVTEDLRLIERLLYQFRDLFSHKSEFKTPKDQK